MLLVRQKNDGRAKKGSHGPEQYGYARDLEIQPNYDPFPLPDASLFEIPF